ncbi:hypothetical protein WA588_001914, partial [Blastocystis sp. NMH]
MKNGVRDGDYTVYKNGMAWIRGSWNELDEEEQRIIENCENEIWMVIRINGEEVYKGGFDGKKRCGYGLVYENGHINYSGVFKDDQLVHIHQRFIDNQQMIEYTGDDNNLPVLNRRPVYMGGYQFDSKTNRYVRHGIGYRFYEHSGICSYQSVWNQGEEETEHQRLFYNGWSQDYSQDKFIRDVVFNDPEPILIGNEPFILSPLTMEELVTEENHFNDPTATQLELTELPRLRRVMIGSSSLRSIRRFVVQGLPELTEFVISPHCLRLTTENEIQSREDGECHFVDCPKLEVIEIGENCFSDYVQLEVTNLPNLQTLSIGRFAFYGSPSVCMRDLPQLQTLLFNSYSFSYCHDIVLENLPSLKFLSLGCMALNGDDRDDRKVNMSEPFQYKNTLVMKDLPSLTQLNGENGNFGNIGIFTFTNIPLLNRKSISFMTTPFDSTKRVNVENASGILGYLKSLKKPVHGK